MAKRYSDKEMLKMVSQILTFDLDGTPYTHYFSHDKSFNHSFAVVSWGVAKKANLLYIKTKSGIYTSFDDNYEKFIPTDSVNSKNNPLANIMDYNKIINKNKNILKTAHRDCYFYLEQFKLQKQNAKIEGALYVCMPNYHQALKDYMVGDNISFDFFTKKIIFGEKPRKKPWKRLDKGYSFNAFVGTRLLLEYTNFKG